MLGAAVSILLALMPIPEVPRFDLTMRIDPAKPSIQVDTHVTLQPVGAATDSIDLVLADQMHDVTVEGAHLSRIGSHEGGTAYRVKLANPIAKGSRPSFHVTYSGGEKTTFVFHIGSDVCFGGSNTVWYPLFGHVSFAKGGVSFDGTPRATGAFKIDVPEGYSAVMPGKRMPEKKADGRVTYGFEIDQPVEPGFAAGKFFVRRLEGQIPVTTFFLKDRANSEGYVTGCRAVARELQKLYGKFPFPEFAVVEVTDGSGMLAGFSGASLPGFMLANTSFLDEPFNLAFFGHEMGHEWWGNVITNNGGDGAYLLDEAMAQYGSLRVVEAIDGPAMAERYRQSGYPGYIATQCGNAYLEMSAAGIDHRLKDLPGANLSHLLADCKGFLVYDMLEREIGRPTFDAVLHDVVVRYGFGSISWPLFTEIVDRRAGRKMDWFWDQWLGRTGAPTVDVHWKLDSGRLAGKIVQQAPAYRLRVPVQINYADGTAEVRRVEIHELETPFSFSIRHPVSSVVVDPRFEILHYTPSQRRDFVARAPLNKAVDLANDGKRDEARTLCDSILASLPKADSAGLEFGAHYVLGSLDRSSDPALARKHLEQALSCAVRVPSMLPRCYLALAQVCQKQGDTERMRWAARRAINAETSAGLQTHVTHDAQKLIGE